MVVVIVLTAILMAMAAPLVVHVADSYMVSTEGADAASVVGPAISRLQWDGRNAYSMSVTSPCVLVLLDQYGNTLEQYSYSGGQLFLNNALILGNLQSSASCPFSAFDTYPYTVLYSFTYVGPSGTVRLPVDGVLSAYAD
jgi:hypothetical protein